MVIIFNFTQKYIHDNLLWSDIAFIDHLIDLQFGFFYTLFNDHLDEMLKPIST